MNADKKSDDNKSPDGGFFSREDISRISSDFLHKTLGGLDALREGIPKEAKEAAQFIKSRKDDIVKGLSKEFVQSIITSGIETFFSIVRQHKLEMTIGIRKNEAQSPQPETRLRKKAKQQTDRGRK